MVAVATKLVTCPALLLLEEPFRACQMPCEGPAAQHLLGSLQTAANKLHINIVVGEETLPEAAFVQFPSVVLLDQAGLTAFAGEPQQVRSLPNTQHLLQTLSEVASGYRENACCRRQM